MVMKLSLSLFLMLIGVDEGEDMLERMVTGLLMLVLVRGLVMILMVLPDKVVMVFKLIRSEGLNVSMSMLLRFARLSPVMSLRLSRRLSTPGTTALKQVTLEV